MQWDNPRFAFPKADQYAFLFENAHLLLLSWNRDQAKFLFLIQEQKDGGLMLDYPGELFVNRVLDTVENIFFVQVEEAGKEPIRYVLGSYFVIGEQPYAAYYERDSENPNVVLFRLDGEAPSFTLEIIEGEEYDRVAAVFSEQHQDIVDIQDANRA